MSFAKGTVMEQVFVTALHLSMLNHELELARRLIDDGANVNEADRKGTRPLHMAVMMCDFEAVQLLVNSAADINVNLADKTGTTPLHLAAFKGVNDIVRLLLEKGANPRAKDKKGRSPIDVADKMKQVQTLSILQAAIQ
jgi:uncharacterized protein